MILSSIEKLAKEIGYDIGNSNDVAQSDLLNGFCEGLYRSMTNDAQRDMQCCYVAGKLSKESHKVLKCLVEFIEVE